MVAGMKHGMRMPGLALVATLALALGGCETMTIRGSLAYVDPSTGAKAGMQVTDDGGGWWVRVPVPAQTEGGTEGGVFLIEGPLPAVDRKSGK